MNYEIKEKPEIILVGFKKRFTGLPYGKERAEQEKAFAKPNESEAMAAYWCLM